MRLLIHEIYFFSLSIDYFLYKYNYSSYRAILDTAFSDIATFDFFIGVVDNFICFYKNFMPLQRFANSIALIFS